MQQLHGDKVRLRAVPMERGGLFARFRRLPGFNLGLGGEWNCASGVVDR